MIIYRYVCSNLIKTSIALTVALMALILFNRFAFYIDDAAEGKIPSALVLVILINSVPELLSFILPLALVISILITYTQLFMSNEITVLHACGLSRKKLFSVMFISALLLIVGITWLAFYASPYGFKQINQQVNAIKQRQFEFLPEASFFNLGDLNIYTESLNRKTKQFENIFIIGGQSKDTMMVAQRGSFEQRGNQTYLILNSGQRIQKQPQTDAYQIIDFEYYGEQIPEIDRAIRIVDQSLTMNISQLFSQVVNGTATSTIKTQFYWDLSVPLMSIILCWIAFSLCDDRPRSSRFQGLLPMLIIFASYFILLKTAKDNGESNSANYLSFIAVHAGFAMLAASFTARRSAFIAKYLK